MIYWTVNFCLRKIELSITAIYNAIVIHNISNTVFTLYNPLYNRLDELWKYVFPALYLYQLREHTVNLSKQQTSLDVRKFSFSQRVVQEWNKLSQDVVEATSVNQFKNRLDKFWQRYGH